MISFTHFKEKTKRKALLPYIGLSFFLHLIFVFFLFFSMKKRVFFLEDLESPLPVKFISIPLNKLPEKIEKREARKKNQLQKLEGNTNRKAITQKTQSKDLDHNLRHLKKLRFKKETAFDREKTSSSSSSLDRTLPFLKSYENVKGLDKIALHDYLLQVENHIHQYWDLPLWLNNLDLKAHVLVFIDLKGAVSKKSLLLSSRSSLFDLKVLEVIEKSSPFPPPPQRLVPILSKGLVLQFPH